MNRKKVALIQGGWGGEKEIGLLSAQAVYQSLKELNLLCEIFNYDESLISRLSAWTPDVAFLAVHGQYGEDGVLQSICEYLRIPYTGSGVLASAICMNKCIFKNYISRYNIPTPEYQNLNLRNINLQEVDITVSIPLVVKPARSGSTLGVSVCHKSSDIRPALEKALKYDTSILVESYVEGREIACSFLSGKALTPVEIITKTGFYDYKTKYKSDEAQYVLAPNLEEKTTQQCKDIVYKMADILDLRSYFRIDFLVKEATPFVIEANTLPGLTAHSLLPMSALHDQISFNDLILEIVQSASLDYNFISKD